MQSDGYAKVLSKLIEYINSNYSLPVKGKLLFDELSTSQDSICLATATSEGSVERKADVTGLYMLGIVRVSINYRVMKPRRGVDDLTHIGALDSLMNFIIERYRQIKDETFYIDIVKRVSSPVLEATYSTGTKDYSCNFEITYERKVN